MSPGGSNCDELPSIDAVVESPLPLASPTFNHSTLPGDNPGEDDDLFGDDNGEIRMSPTPPTPPPKIEQRSPRGSPIKQPSEILSSTPIKRGGITVDEPKVTPLPDYERMLTPALRQELRRFGLKAIPRRKAVPLLRHIYHETHSQAALAAATTKKKSKLEPEKLDDGGEDVLDVSNASQESNHSTASYSDQDLPEESIFFGEQEVEEEPAPATSGSTQSVPLTTDSLSDLVLNHIRSKRGLYRQALTYDPIWLEPFFNDLKEAHPESLKKVKLPEIMDILDTECITFRTAAQASSNRRRNRKSPSKRKAAGSKSQAAKKTNLK